MKQATNNKELIQLIQESSELIKVICSKLFNNCSNIHLEDKIASVMASCRFVVKELDLNPHNVVERANAKLELMNKSKENID